LHGHPAIADIASGDDVGLNLAARVTDETAMRFQGNVGSVLSLHSVFDYLANASLESLLSSPGHQGPVVGVDLLERNGAFQFFLGVAEETLIRGVVIDAVTGLVDNSNQIGTVLCDGTEQLVRPVFRFFGFFVLSNFADEVLV
jgi:hypothetical protein